MSQSAPTNYASAAADRNALFRAALRVQALPLAEVDLLSRGARTSLEDSPGPLPSHLNVHGHLPTACIFTRLSLYIRISVSVAVHHSTCIELVICRRRVLPMFTLAR